VAVDEYEVEPWHYRYVGRQMATRLYSLEWTYTEFVRFQEAVARR
jgi:LAS superfamily LD-carboxypeptidase LdcB